MNIKTKRDLKYAIKYVPWRIANLIVGIVFILVLLPTIPVNWLWERLEEIRPTKDWK